MKRDAGRIYALIDPRDGRVRYVGKTVKTAQERLKDHLWSRPKSIKRPLYRWITELLASHVFPQIVVLQEVGFPGIDRVEQLKAIDTAEREWIAHFRATGAALLNLTAGGNGCHGRKLSAESIAKISAANRARVRTSETRERLRAAALARGEKHYQRGMESEGWGDQIAKGKKSSETWGKKSSDERTAHAARHLGEANVNAVITAEIAREINERLLARGQSQREIARQFGIHHIIVHQIKSGQTWRQITGRIKEERVS